MTSVASLVKRLASGLEKTRTSLLGNVRRLMAAKDTIDQETLDEVEIALLAADVGTQTTAALIENMQRRVREEHYHSPEELASLLRDEVMNVFRAHARNAAGIEIPDSIKPFVIMVVGVNGAGKTTTVGKLGYQFKRKGHKVVMGAADTFRAAANEQLEVWAERAGAHIVRQKQGADPASVAFDTISSAIASSADVVLIDTAGRLHTKTNLMEELRKIRRVIEKRLPGAPHEVLLVLDAGTGQNGLQQARQFSQAVGVTGLALTKLDGTAKGGIVLAACAGENLPVKYVGVGEELEDLQPFDHRAFVDALFPQS